MPGRRVPAVLAAILASTVLLFSGTGGGGVPGAAAAPSCPSGQRQAFVTLRSTITWSTYGEVYNGGGQPQIVNRRSIYSGNSGKATFTFCVAKGTSWAIKKGIDIIGYDYYHVSASLNADGTGFLLRPGYVKATSVTVEPTICRQDSRFDTFVKLATIPIPGAHYIVAVGQYLLGSVDGSSTTCRKFSSASVPIHFQSNGDTYADDFSRVYTDKVPESFGCTGTQCYLVNEWVWRVVSP